MPRNRGIASFSEALGQVSNVFRAFRELGVGDDHWSLIVRSSEYRKRVAELVLELCDDDTEHRLTQFIRKAKITELHSAFMPPARIDWLDRGQGVRGQFHNLAYGGRPEGTTIEAFLHGESRRLGVQLSPATCYELIAYAAEDWSGTGSVVATGSVFHDAVTGEEYMPELSGWSPRRLAVVHKATLLTDLPRGAYLLCVGYRTH